MEQDLIQKLAGSIEQTAAIEPELFKRYGVKRGLRNEDGTGVLVGLTRIGDVVGYTQDDQGNVMPAPGRLLYRGYDVSSMVQAFITERRFGFEEVAYLLLCGQLPNADELDQFRHMIIEQMPLSHEAVMSILSLRGTNVMNILARSVLELYTYDPDPEDMSRQHTMEQSIGLISRFPTIIAYAYNELRHQAQKLPLHIRLPKPELSFAENFLYVLRKTYTELDARVLDLLLVLQAEHGGGNNSAFTVRVTSSTMTDIYSSISAGIGSLKGPLHGGANLEVAGMMDYLHGAVHDWTDAEEVKSCLQRILSKEAYDGKGLIYGIGHAVYTVSDPRIGPLRMLAGQLAAEKGRTEELNFLDLVLQEAVPLVSTSKKNGAPVSANVDFYSGFLYDLIGIPRELYTPVFAMSRIVGWVSHRIEEINFAGRRIIRPAYRNVLTEEAEYIPLSDR